MECNRDEATRAKAIAERKVTEKDFSSAKKFALKAQTLYPDLEGISQMITTLDVYIASENRVCGEFDWYGILSVHPSADEETVKKQFRKLALVLHPDKNNSIGAEGAFKLVSEAWGVLSDKSKRLAYNQRRSSNSNSKMFPQKNSSQTAPYPPHGPNGFSAKSRNNNRVSSSRSDTFWTICHRCKMHYEYIRVYLNHTLRCPTCHEAFLASEAAPPANFPTSRQNPTLRSDPVKTQNSNRGLNERIERTKREHQASDDLVTKRARLNEDKPYQMDTTFAKKWGFFQTEKRSISIELSPLEIRNMLMEKALTEIRKKLNQWNKREKVKTTVTGRRSGDNDDDVEKVGPAPAPMNVPDPDFHDFDVHRTEKSFGENEVWAGYDDDDGMPRFYAMIHKVIAKKPLKMKISWLNSKTNAEFGPSEWVNSGFFKTCGEFRIGKYEIYKTLNSFSHKVKWTKGARGTIHIFPQKGDIWALYRNWSTDWNRQTPAEVIHKYDVVQIMDDYNEEQGVLVTPLVKVAGFRTVFCPHSDKNKVIKIPKEEMFRFSHQIPNHLITGEEAPNAPKGCQELDPAAISLELLQPQLKQNNSVNLSKNGEEN